ncbi:MAG: hypothetical protein WCW53_00220 [Syntrophales bacterium]|jgi:hypothetical protein
MNFGLFRNDEIAWNRFPRVVENQDSIKLNDNNHFKLSGEGKKGKLETLFLVFFNDQNALNVSVFIHPVRQKRLH